MDITLDSVVRGYLMNGGHNTLHRYLRSLKYCVDFLKKFNVNHSYGDRTVELKLDYKKTIQYPEDLIVFKKIGWVSGDRVVSFDIDETISLHHDHTQDGISGTPNSAYSIIQPYNRTTENISGDITYQTTGVGYNYSGYFKFNNEAREIQFSSEIPSTRSIYVTYASNGFNPKTKSKINALYSTVAENYIHWQWGRFKLGDSSAETEARRQAFWNDYDNIYAATQRISYEGLIGIKARAHDVNKTV